MFLAASLCIAAHLHALPMSHLAITSVLSRGWTPQLATSSNMKKKQPKCVPFEKKVLFLCEYNSVVSVYVSEMEIVYSILVEWTCHFDHGHI